MKYFVAARPGPMPPSPEQFDAAIEWLDGKLQDGTFDCIFGFKLPSRRRGRTVSHAQWEPMAADYQRPGWFTKYVFNPIVAGLTRMGVSLVGSRVLEVRGRTSGEWRRTPVNPLDFDGQRYIVAPRGETQWVRNLRASGEGRLRRGSRVEEFTATELADEDKVPLLRAYLKKWAWEVGAFFQGVGADAPDEDLRRIAPLHPVFRISRR